MTNDNRANWLKLAVIENVLARAGYRLQIQAIDGQILRHIVRLDDDVAAWSMVDTLSGDARVGGAAW